MRAICQAAQVLRIASHYSPLTTWRAPVLSLGEAGRHASSSSRHPHPSGPNERVLDSEMRKKKGKSRTPPKPRPKVVLPDLIESELDETWVRGSGPGGQVINKTNISCSLVHIPTGIRVQNHETRSRELNRLKARRRMQELLDMHFNRGNSALEAKWERERQKKEAKRRKGKRRRAADADAVTTQAQDEGDGEATD